MSLFFALGLLSFKTIVVKFPYYGENPGGLERGLGISIESFRHDTVLAYTDEEGLRRLKALGYDPEIIIPDTRSYTKGLFEKGTYHSYAQVISIMTDSAAAHPEICRLDTLGLSVEGRLILAWRITDNPDQEEPEPEVRVMGNIHGDEVIGCEIPLYFGLHLLKGYGSDPVITRMVDSVEIWVVPMMNPDGHEHGYRENVHGVDLNRDAGYYWDGWGGSSAPFGEPESRVYFAHALENEPSMEWVYHSAAWYVNYPWDYSPKDPPDSGLIITLCQIYADSDYMQEVTNGFDWYQVCGSVQDVGEGIIGGYAITIETDQPSNGSAQIDSICARSTRALRGLISRAGWGVWGIVRDSLTGAPLKARVDFINPDRITVFTDEKHGDYHKLLSPGTYTLRFSAQGYSPKEVSGVVVPSSGAVRVDADLVPDSEYNYAFRVIYVTLGESGDDGWEPDIRARTWETLGPPDGIYQPLGCEGSVRPAEIVLDFGLDSAIVDLDTGPDLRVYEGDASSEPYAVYVSSAWTGGWVSCGTGSGSQDFEIPGSGGVYRYLRIVSSATSDADSLAGFDLDAVRSYTRIGGVGTTEDDGPGSPGLRAFAAPGRECVLVRFVLSDDSNVLIRAYDPTGRLALSEDLGILRSGEHEAKLELRKGIWLVRIGAGPEETILKAIVR
ncbi:MAG: M14 family zinc carboxypeptidase [candidate division WOR-3 bacterium]